jgi:hypothetical protein
MVLILNRVDSSKKSCVSFAFGFFSLVDSSIMIATSLVFRNSFIRSFSAETVSKLVIIALMFGGRVGGLTLMLTFAEKKVNHPVDRPKENVIVG